MNEQVYIQGAGTYRVGRDDVTSLDAKGLFGTLVALSKLATDQRQISQAAVFDSLCRVLKLALDDDATLDAFEELLEHEYICVQDAIEQDEEE